VVIVRQRSDSWRWAVQGLAASGASAAFDVAARRPVELNAWTGTAAARVTSERTDTVWVPQARTVKRCRFCGLESPSLIVYSPPLIVALRFYLFALVPVSVRYFTPRASRGFLYTHNSTLPWRYYSARTRNWVSLSLAQNNFPPASSMSL
jgi:hypothetical protein